MCLIAAAAIKGGESIGYRCGFYFIWNHVIHVFTYSVFHLRTTELEFDLRGRIELSPVGNFAFIDQGEAKLKPNLSEVRKKHNRDRLLNLLQGHSLSSPLLAMT